MAKRDYDFGKRIQRSNAKAEADRAEVREAMRSYAGLVLCRCGAEQEDAPECVRCGAELK
jgi:hypothetical protein